MTTSDFQPITDAMTTSDFQPITDAMTTSDFQPVALLDPGFLYKFSCVMANSADPGHLPIDLDLHCLQRLAISGFSRTRVKTEGLDQNAYPCSLITSFC